MHPFFIFAILFACVLTGAVVAVWLLLRQRNMDQWIRGHIFPDKSKTRIDWRTQPVDVFIAVCDHYEPEWNKPDFATSLSRVERWVKEYPEVYGRFRDSSGRPPQHTFFYPQDEYKPEYLDALAPLIEAGYGEVEIHLHHDNDTEDGLREKLTSFRDTLYHRHNMLRRDPVTGEIVYSFIHGNWALCNSRPDGRWCGVKNELNILRETGCYADLTMPSAPSNTQTSTINSIYYAQDKPGECKSHDRGISAAVNQTPPDHSLLMIQGPLTLDWGNRKFGVIPRIENSDLHVNRPPTWRRLELWLDAAVTVQGKPDWLFVKLHTHGCKDGNIDTLLSDQVHGFHNDLAEFAQANENFRYHYVTAWDMANLIHQAERGETAVQLRTVPAHV